MNTQMSNPPHPTQLALASYPSNQITGIVSQESLMDPPKPETLAKKRTVIYVVDSRDRNLDLYPNPANYKIDLSEEFHDVKAIELLSIQLPEVIYTINHNNDQLDIYYGDQCLDLHFPHGKYRTGKSLAKCIESGLNRGLSEYSSQKLYRVSFIKRLHKLVNSNICYNQLNIYLINQQNQFRNFDSNSTIILLIYTL